MWGIILEALFIPVSHAALAGVACCFYGRERKGGKNGRGSLIANLLAYNIIAVSYACYSALVGTRAWFDGSAADVGDSLHDRIYGYSESAATISALTIAYELYNTIAVLFLHEYRNAAFIGHHSTTFVLGLLVSYPFLHYYVLFFFGVTAISSAPLAMVELMHILKLSKVEVFCRGLFCIFFLAIRTVYWPIVSYYFWADELAALNGAVPVHSYFSHIFLLVANIFLTALQFYWTKVIFCDIASWRRQGC